MPGSLRGRQGMEKIANLHRQHSQRGQYLNVLQWMLTAESPGSQWCFSCKDWGKHGVPLSV